MMRCEYTLTWKLFSRWAMREQLEGRKLVINVLILLFGAVNLYLAFPFNLMSLMQISLGGMCVYVVFFFWRYNAKNQYRRTARVCGENWRRVITFSDSLITFSDGPSVRDLKYADIKKLREKAGEITLTFEKGAKLIFYADSFTKGSWQECRVLLREKANV